MAIGRKPNVQGLCGPDVSLEMKMGKLRFHRGLRQVNPVFMPSEMCVQIFSWPM